MTPFLQESTTNMMSTTVLFRHLFLVLMIVHGLIHLLGFFKAFSLLEVNQLTQAISKPTGIGWLLTTLFFIVSAFLFSRDHPNWFWWALTAIVCSQVLIVFSWQDAKFGTLANLILLIVAFVALSSWRFESIYRKDVANGLARTAAIVTPLLQENDLAHLPAPVQSYLRYAGVVGQPKVKNFRLTFQGEMREKGKDWFPFTTEQYNFFDDPRRLFFMKANFKGLPTHGYHAYLDGAAQMQIKVLSLIPVVNLQGKDLFQAETVTFFNDLCLYAPAALIDKNIQWEALDEYSVKAVFQNRGVQITAILHFNAQGQLINFVSDDRIDVNQQKTIRFSTPISDYQNWNDYQLASYGEAVWHYPDGAFCYGKFHLQSIEYNVNH
jgi:uncharacterized membrane protein YbaN (DUF454 family)